MARIISPEKLSGSIGDRTYYTKNGVTYVRQKSSLTKKSMLKNKNFERTLKNASDFGEASKNGAMLRNVFAAEWIDIHDSKFHLRMSGIFREALRLKNQVIKQEISLNQALSLPEIRHAFGLLEVNTEYRKMLVWKTVFNPENPSILIEKIRLRNPDDTINSTHGYFHCAVARIDFTNKNHDLVQINSDIIELENMPEQLELKFAKLPDGTGPMFLVIRFIHGVQDEFGFREMKNNRFRNASLSILL